jgi:hypothetical protein
MATAGVAEHLACNTPRHKLAATRIPNFAVLKFANSLWTTDGQLQSCIRRLVNTRNSLGLELEDPGLRCNVAEKALSILPFTPQTRSKSILIVGVDRKSRVTIVDYELK